MLGRIGQPQRLDEQRPQPAERQVGPGAGQRTGPRRGGGGHPAQREQQRRGLPLDVGHRAELDQPGPASAQDGGEQQPVQPAVLDQDPLAQRRPQHRPGHRAGRRRCGAVLGPGGPAGPVLQVTDPGQQGRRLAVAGLPAAVELGVRGPERGQVVVLVVHRLGVDRDQGSGAGELHPLQHPGGRPGAQGQGQRDPAELSAVAGGEGPQLGRLERRPVPGQVGEPGPAVPQDRGVVPADARRQRRGDPAVEPGQHRRGPGHRPRGVEVHQRRGRPAELDRRAARRQVRLDRGRRDLARLQDAGRPPQQGQVRGSDRRQSRRAPGRRARPPGPPRPTGAGTGTSGPPRRPRPRRGPGHPRAAPAGPVAAGPPRPSARRPSRPARRPLPGSSPAPPGAAGGRPARRRTPGSARRAAAPPRRRAGPRCRTGPGPR